MLAPVGSRFICLDAGRGLAAVVVLWHHVTVFYGSSIEHLLADWALAQKVSTIISELNFAAVMFFFYISGWSIAISTYRLMDSSGRGIWRFYLRNRARRILPLYWLSLVWSFALTAGYAMADGSRSLSTLLGNLLFLQSSASVPGAFVMPFAGNGPLWSLSYEVWYYLALPVIYLVVLPLVPRKLRSLEMAMISAILVGPVAIALNRYLPNPMLLFASLWPIWLSGYIFACASGNRTQEMRCVAIIFCSLTLFAALSHVVRSDTLNALCDGLLVATVVSILVILRDLPSINEILHSKPIYAILRILAWTGHGSYSIYILHYPLLLLLVRAEIGLGAAVIVMLGLVILSPAFKTMMSRLVAPLPLFRNPPGRDSTIS